MGGTVSVASVVLVGSAIAFLLSSKKMWMFVSAAIFGIALGGTAVGLAVRNGVGGGVDKGADTVDDTTKTNVGLGPTAPGPSPRTVVTFRLGEQPRVTRGA